MHGQQEETLRLQLYLARCGICSRRSARGYIEEGRVSVNGKVELEPWFRVGEKDKVTFDAQAITLVKRKIYLVLHKPPFYLSSLHDPQGRPLVSELVRPLASERLFHVGRLDYLSTGLLLLTNDGYFSSVVSHPGYCCEKEYDVETCNRIPEALLDDWLGGLVIDQVLYRLEAYRLLNRNRVQLLLHEGKNREIRRVFRAGGISIKTIHRYRVGSLTLRGLAEGKARHLLNNEVKTFLEQKRVGYDNYN